jgi:hypothetical protein
MSHKITPCKKQNSTQCCTNYRRHVTHNEYSAKREKTKKEGKKHEAIPIA